VYDRADLLLDTASVAGVPTTFLEAWARGVPVVSTIDPEGMVAANNLGRVVTDVAGMAAAVEELLRAPGAWAGCSQAARAYYEQHHTVQASALGYHRLFNGQQA